MWYLLVTVAADVLGVILLSQAQGFLRPWYLVIGMGLMAVGFVAFSFATKSLPASLANAVWSSASIALVLVYGRVFLREQVTTAQYACVGLIALGTVGLSVLGKPSA